MHDKKQLFIEHIYFWKSVKPNNVCHSDLIFGPAEHLVTLTLYTALSLYHLKEMCHFDLILYTAFYLALKNEKVLTCNFETATKIHHILRQILI